MFLQCLKCRLCDFEVPDSQLRFLSYGVRQAPILFLDDIVENIWISDKSAALIDVDFGDDVNEQNIAGIGLFLRVFESRVYSCNSRCIHVS